MSGLYIDELVQERRNSSALAMELRLSCTKPLICPSVVPSMWCPLCGALCVPALCVPALSVCVAVLNHLPWWGTTASDGGGVDGSLGVPGQLDWIMGIHCNS